MPQVVEFRLQTTRENFKVQLVEFFNFLLKPGQVRDVASPQDLDDCEHMPKASDLALHRGEVIIDLD